MRAVAVRGPTRLRPPPVAPAETSGRPVQWVAAGYDLLGAHPVPRWCVAVSQDDYEAVRIEAGFPGTAPSSTSGRSAEAGLVEAS